MTEPAVSVSPAARPDALHGLAWTLQPVGALRADAALQTAWDRLNDGRGALPFLTAEAVAIAVDVFGDGGERLLVARRGADVAAMLVVVPHGRLQWRTFQPSQVPLGVWVADAALGADALAAAALAAMPGFCLVFSLTQVDPRLAPREADGPATEHADYVDTAWVDVVAGGFDAYWSRRGKNLRQNMRKQRNRLAAEGTRTTLRVWTEPDQMKPALARYGALESAGWKAAEGTAIHADNAQGRFYAALLEGAARRGEAVVYEYLFDERSVAINLCLRRHGVLVVLKTTYDESIKLFSPAFLLREEELKALFGDGGIARIEYYGRVMDWHTKLTENRRTLYQLTAYRWPLLKKLAQARRKTASTVESRPADAVAQAETEGGA